MDSDKYNIVNGTSYNKETSQEVINILEDIRENKIRIILDYGDTETGESWGEFFNIIGRIGRSTGTYKIPILVHNSRSMGGGAILDHRIIGIKTSKGKNVLYKLKIKQD